MELFDVLKARAGIPVDDPFAWLLALKLGTTEYRFVEYLQNSGTQYIETDIVPDYQTRLEVNLELTYSVNNASEGLFGYGGYQGAHYRIVVNKGSYGMRADFYDGNSHWTGDLASVTKDTLLNQRVLAVLDRPECSWGSDVVAYPYSINANSPIFGFPFFATSGNFGGISRLKNFYYRLYSAVFSKNGSVSHWLIPAERKRDSALGLYDMMTGNFYPGTGTFQKGDYFEPYQTSDGLILKTSNAQIYLVKEES